MAIFWHRKRKIAEEKAIDKISDIEVEKVKKQLHKAADDATDKLSKVNRLYRANGLALKILIATGGDKRAH